MPIQFNCPACGAGLHFKEQFAGTRVPCPRCSSPIDVPLTRVPQGAGNDSNPNLQGKKILIVDDDHFARLLLKSALGKQGATILLASDGNDAIETISRERPDLVLLDLSLPGDSGLGVLERLAALHEHTMTPVIVISASDPQTHKNSAIHAGAMAFLQKPINLTDLLGTVHRVLA